MEPRWAEVLDDMELRLARAESVLHGGAEQPSPLTLPPGLGPIPAHLVGRAQRIHSDTDQLAAAVAEARTRLAAGLRRRPTGEPSPAYLDTRA